MTPRFSLLFRNLRHFRGVNLAVIVGMAVATAVLTGAMMVGDSVRGSLTHLAIQRLGPVDYALVGTRFFNQSLGERVARDGKYQVLPAIIVRGEASAERSKSHTADVQIAALTPAGPNWAFAEQSKSLINGTLAEELATPAVGDAIVLSVPSGGDTPRDATLSRRARGDSLGSFRTNLASVVTAPGFASMFNPAGGQRPPRNAWVNLADLQEAVEQPGRVNALLVHDPLSAPADQVTRELNQALAREMTLEDYGLTVTLPVSNGAEAALGSRATYLPSPIVTAGQRIAARDHVPLQTISVNLINAITTADKTIHYVVAAGVSPLDGADLAPDAVAINQWTADQLGAKVGDAIRIDYYERSSGTGELSDASKHRPASELTFRVARILPMSGIGADPSLPPDYKGLTDADSVADWDPPEGLKIDKSLVTKEDEAYWKQYRAAPKLFFSFPTAEKLWGGVYGNVTGLRVPANAAGPFFDSLRRELSPAQLGLSFRSIRAEQLAAANGGTDFAEYFISFSFFLIVAATLLVAMLFRLNVEQRARQLGLLSAVGYSPRRLRRLALGEGMLLAVIGGLVGLGGAIGYTWLIMAGLRTWWVGAVGTTAMHLYVNPQTLVIGLVASLIVAFFAILWGAWRIGRVPPATLLAGAWESETRTRRGGKILRILGMLAALAGIGAIAAGVAKVIPADVAFMTSGGVMLCAFLLWLGGAMRPRARRSVGFLGVGSVLRLGIRNTSRHTARSVLAIGLIAFAVFILIVVAVMRQGGPPDTSERKSGAGGFALILKADIPLLGDLNTVEGRRLLGIRAPVSPIYQSARFTPMRSWAGQDISCLNLTKPTQPTILSVPHGMIERNAFTAGGALGKPSNFWSLLESDQGDAIPVIADAETAQYILRLSIGQELPITDQLGNPRKLKLVATVANSIFQGELLMGDGNFRRLFPAQSGWSIVLIDCPAGNAADLARTLSSELEDYSVSVDTTAQRLMMYQSVANTYLSTFQTLGSLGLLLGTLGLAVVLVRTVIERKPELALLASLGFRPASRIELVLAENAALLLIGLLVGNVCAIIAVLPAVREGGRHMNFASLGATLLGVIATGMIASAIAVCAAGVHISPADLRRE